MELKKPKNYSISQLNKYLDCPRSHYYQYVCGLEVPSTSAQDYGKKCHTYLEQYLRGEISSFPNDFHGRTCQAGLNYLPAPKSGNVEMKFEMNLDNLVVPIIGYMDYCSFDTDSNKAILLDHKVVKSDQYALTTEKLASTNQIIVYSKFLLDYYKTDMVQAAYLYFKRGGSWVNKVTVELNRDKIEKSFDNLSAKFEDMQQNYTTQQEENVPQILASCEKWGGCPFKNKCWGTQQGDNTMSLLDKLLASTAKPKTAENDLFGNNTQENLSQEDESKQTRQSLFTQIGKIQIKPTQMPNATSSNSDNSDLFGAGTDSAVDVLSEPILEADEDIDVEDERSVFEVTAESEVIPKVLISDNQQVALDWSGADLIDIQDIAPVLASVVEVKNQNNSDISSSLAEISSEVLESLSEEDIMSNVEPENVVEVNALVVEQSVEVVAEPVVEQPVEVVAEPVVEQPVEVAAEPVVEQPVEIIAEPVVEQPVEIIAEPVVEQAVEVVAEPVVEQAVEVVAEPVVEQAVEVVAEPVVEQAVEVVAEPVVEQAVEVVAEPVVEQAVEVVAEPIIDETEFTFDMEDSESSPSKNNLFAFLQQKITDLDSLSNRPKNNLVRYGFETLEEVFLKYPTYLDLKEAGIKGFGKSALNDLALFIKEQVKNITDHSQSNLLVDQFITSLPVDFNNEESTDDTNQIVLSLAEPVIEQNVEVVAAPIVEPVNELVNELVNEQNVEVVAAPVNEPVNELVNEPVNEPVNAQNVEVVVAPVVEHVKEESKPVDPVEVEKTTQDNPQAKGKEPESASSFKIVLLGCMPIKGVAFVCFEDLVSGYEKNVEEVKQVPHIAMVEYGKGYDYLATVVKNDITHKKFDWSKAVYISTQAQITYAKTVHSLIQAADIVIRNI